MEATVKYVMLILDTEAADRADIRRRYEAILTMESKLTASGRNA